MNICFDYRNVYKVLFFQFQLGMILNKQGGK